MIEITAEALREKRKTLKASVPLISIVLGVPSASFYKWEKGTRPVGSEVNKKLEKLMNGDYDEIIIQKIADEKSGKSSREISKNRNFDGNVENYLLKEKVIKSLEETIQTQKKLIDHLQEKLDKITQDSGKAGARRNSA